MQVTTCGVAEGALEPILRGTHMEEKRQTTQCADTSFSAPFAPFLTNSLRFFCCNSFGSKPAFHKMGGRERERKTKYASASCETASRQ
jgi:hypothetical protein